MQRPRMTLAMLLLVGFGGSSKAWADLVYFKGGGQAQLPTKRDGTRVTLETPEGSFEFDATDFRKVVPGYDPPAEWPSRLDAARKGTLGEAFAAAWWALENGLTDEATGLLAEIHAKDASHQPTASLVGALARVAPKLDDPPIGPLIESLTGAFRESRSAHFLLLHQSDDTAARARLRLLEQVYTTYYLTIAARGLDLPPPRNRLVSAAFARQDHYLEFLRREHAKGFSTSQGFYHPTRNVVVSFDPAAMPTQRSARDAIDARRREVSGLEAAITRIRPDERTKIESAGDESRTYTRLTTRSRLDSLRRDISRQSLLLDLDRRAIDIGMTAHEAIHQLVANSNLVPRHDDFPTWLHEGFAAQFEVVRGGRWAGVGRAHDLRLPDLRSIFPIPHLASIIRDEGYGLGYRRDLYAEAWALVYFLRKQHPEEFTHFLDRLRKPSVDPNQTKSRVMDAFRASFGDDLPKIEADWHRFMRGTNSPLEEGATELAPPRPEMRPSRN